MNLISIQPSLRSTETSFFFFSFCFSAICFSLFAWRFHEVLAFHQSFHVFSHHVVCYFLLITHIRTCKKITLARQVISPGVFIWGKRRHSSPRRYIGLFKKIYWLGNNTLPVSCKQVGDILVESTKTRFIVWPSYIG